MGVSRQVATATYGSKRGAGNPHPINIELGKRCAELRKKRGKTQLQVAMDIDTTPESISAFENGRTNNARILVWYLERIRTFDEFTLLIRGLDNA